MSVQNEVWTIAGPSQLIKTTRPKPVPGPHQALVRMIAASLNYRDVLIVKHSPAYPLAPAPNLVPCSDGAGVIEAAGPESAWSGHVGETVSIHGSTWFSGDATNLKMNEIMGGGNMDGTLQRYAVLDDKHMMQAPKTLSALEASGLFTAGLPVWNALFEGPVKCEPGMTVLTMGTGGVSCFAIQIAVAAGATVIATSSSDEKLVTAKKLGASYLINYRKTPNWADEVLRITNGRGVDHVVEVGGSSTIEESLRSARTDGLVSVLGILSAPKKSDLIPPILFGAKTVRGVLGAGSKEMNERFHGFLEKHDIHPVITKVFEFDDAPAALKSLEQQNEIGKIMIKIGE